MRPNETYSLYGKDFTIFTVPNGMDREVAAEFSSLGEKPMYIPAMHGRASFLYILPVPAASVS